MLPLLCFDWIFLLISIFYCRGVLVGEFLADFTFILLNLLFIRSQKARRRFVPWDSGGLARRENKAVDIVLQLCCLVNPTLVLVIVLCFWTSGHKA